MSSGLRLRHTSPTKDKGKEQTINPLEGKWEEQATDPIEGKEEKQTNPAEEKGEEQVYANEQYKLGLKYFDDGQYEKAFKAFENAALLDYDHAQYQLGLLYEFGFGAPKSISKASELYTKCALKENKAAINRLKELAKM